MHIKFALDIFVIDFKILLFFFHESFILLLK